ASADTRKRLEQSMKGILELAASANTTRLPEHIIEGVPEQTRHSHGVLLYLPNLHVLNDSTLVDGSYACTLVQTAIAHGEIQCLALATPATYDASLATDGVFARHFQPVFVRPPSQEEIVEILRCKRDFLVA